MNCEKYIGLEVHQATISVAVRDSKGKVVMESILETKASTANLLGLDDLEPVYHGQTGVRTLRELARSYLTTKDLTRVMSRLKAVYRSGAIPCAGRDVYYTRHWAEWLAKIKHAGVRRRAEHLYEHLDLLKRLRQQVRRELLAESRKHTVTAKLRQIPCVGPIRRGPAGGSDPDSPSFSHEAPAVGVQRTRLRDPCQRGALLCKRTRCDARRNWFPSGG